MDGRLEISKHGSKRIAFSEHYDCAVNSMLYANNEYQ